MAVSLKFASHAIIVIILTLLSQIGGVIWLVSRFLPKYKKTAFVLLYMIASLGVSFIAPYFGRVRLPIMSTSLHAASPIYWMLNRNFATPELAAILRELSEPRGFKLPDGIRYLDASFPFGSLPLLPHLSHNYGKKIDLAFYYKKKGNYTDQLRSPIGYFAFEYPQTEQCPNKYPTLRWDLRWLQPFWQELEIDSMINKDILIWLRDHGAKIGISKVFVEPHILQKLDLSGDIFRFQGCRAARHDDHIHFQIE